MTISIGNAILRMRTLEDSRIEGIYWHVVIDATHLYSFDEYYFDHYPGGFNLSKIFTF